MTGLFKLFVKDNRILAEQLSLCKAVKTQKRVLEIDSSKISDSFFDKFLNNPSSAYECFSLIVDNKLISKVIINYVGPNTNKNQIFLTALSTLPEYRRMRYSTMFMRLLSEYFSDKIISLGVEPNNIIAYNFYVQCGFSVIKRNCFDNRYKIEYTLMANRKTRSYKEME